MVDSVTEKLKKYKERGEVLRQIHSDRAFFYSTLDSCYSVALIVATAGTTFLGFVGLDKLRVLLAATWKPETFEFIFNSSVFLILLLTILNLIFRFQERRNAHDRAIFALTNLIQEVEDQLHLPLLAGTEAAVLERFRGRYATVTNVLPPTTDRQFLRSKERYLQKKRDSKKLEEKFAAE